VKIPHKHVPSTAKDNEIQYHQFLLHVLTNFLLDLSSVFLCHYKHNPRLEKKLK